MLYILYLVISISPNLCIYLLHSPINTVDFNTMTVKCSLLRLIFMVEIFLFDLVYTGGARNIALASNVISHHSLKKLILQNNITNVTPHNPLTVHSVADSTKYYLSLK